MIARKKLAQRRLFSPDACPRLALKDPLERVGKMQFSSVHLAFHMIFTGDIALQPHSAIDFSTKGYAQLFQQNIQARRVIPCQGNVELYMLTDRLYIPTPLLRQRMFSQVSESENLTPKAANRTCSCQMDRAVL